MGLGRRTFAPGEVLTASNVMNYLQDQAVMSFAGTAARGSAIGSAVSEGMVSYLNDLNQIQVYDGSAWRQVYPSVANTGEIVQVLQTTKTNFFTTTSLSYVDVTDISQTITPKSSSNKILITIAFFQSTNSTSQSNQFQILRNSTAIGNTSNGLMTAPYNNDAVGGGWVTLNYLDSPATTSATTYKLQVRLSGAATGYVGAYPANTGVAHLSTITVMEVVA